MADDVGRQRTWKEFSAAVNMTASELTEWLDGDESKSTGHAGGRHLVAILETKKADLSLGDYDHMQEAVGYVKRHLAQRPSGEVDDSSWRFSLMNWGHDPLRKNS
ncbi:DUF3140 domain-containing protein [Mycobacterium sp. AT1]|uniref:DUF3140 domain-containing protein n=1 Tax=Mycobacterium sp. AT1 TaxID=1961706 RepID=UPI0009AED699|nr:DUF3140 domain-containing protein [Mycobacterium sp. AT1]OPX07587.1 DNA-binding protein [Mycobacterium sp. AT1]